MDGCIREAPEDVAERDARLASVLLLDCALLHLDNPCRLLARILEPVRMATKVQHLEVCLVVLFNVARLILRRVAQAWEMGVDTLTADSHALGELTFIHSGLEIKDYTRKEG